MAILFAAMPARRSWLGSLVDDLEWLVSLHTFQNLSEHNANADFSGAEWFQMAASCPAWTMKALRKACHTKEARVSAIASMRAGDERNGGAVHL